MAPFARRRKESTAPNCSPTPLDGLLSSDSLPPDSDGISFIPITSQGPLPLGTRAPRKAHGRSDRPRAQDRTLEPAELPEGSPSASRSAGESPASGPASQPILRQGRFWLQGDAVFCACPDCGAPLAIRVWLMLAECWQCGITIELTEEEQREVTELLEKRQAKATAAPAPTTPATQPQPQAPASRPAPVRPQPAAQRPAPVRPAAPAIAAPPIVRRPPRRQPARSLDWLHAVPAWLVSLVAHLLLLIVLALMAIEPDLPPSRIRLSCTISKDVREGGNPVKVPPREDVDFDLPIPEYVDMEDERHVEALRLADAAARELRIDPRAQPPELPRLPQVQQQIRDPQLRNLAAARDPRVRVEVVAQEGGTTLTEAAVARGLRWLAIHQEPDGRWSLDRFDRHSGCICGGTAGLHSDAAATSLALLPFLGAGQTDRTGRYQETVARGLSWLVEQQRSNGDLRGRGNDNAGMYAHGQAAIVLSEAYLMTGDDTYRQAAQRAIDFIVAAQHEQGGWRYHPGQPGDTSVLGWQLMALQSARAAELNVPDRTLRGAERYLDSVQAAGGALYSYQRYTRPTHVMTAEALLCRIYLGWDARQPALLQGADYLLVEHPPDIHHPDIYYWYYATQTFHHLGGPRWESWNEQMREVLVELQETRGHAAGSWSPRGPFSDAGGRIYMTSLAICTLEVYYRHLPLFRQIGSDE